MLKNLFLAFICLYSLTSLAQELGTDVAVSPFWPSTCRVSEFKTTLNTLYEVERVFEDDSRVTYQFKTQYVQCADGQLVPYELQNPVVEIDRQTVLPFGRSHVKTKLELLSDNELLVTLSFDKRSIFKNDKKQQAFELLFLPRGVGLSQVIFWWKLELIRDVVLDEVKLQLSQRP